MRRKELEDLGLSKEQADAVMKINGTDIENAKEVASAEVTNLKAENENLEKQVKDRDKQIEGLKSSASDNEELKKLIEQLQKDNKAQADAHTQEIQKMKLDAAVEKALADAGAKNVNALRGVLGNVLKDAKLSDDGTVKGLAEQIEKLKGDDGTKFLFNETGQNQQNRQQFTGFQPGNPTTVPNSTQAGYEARIAEARKNGNQLEVIKIKQEAFQNDGIALM